MIYTIGHSTMSEADFIKTMGEIPTLLDVRSHPGSRRNPQFNYNVMDKWLLAAGKNLSHMPGLGGWDVRHGNNADLVARMATVGVPIRKYGKGFFPKQQIAKDRPTEGVAWTNAGLYDYSWFMILPEFLEAANILIEMGKTEDVAICCCELLWWKCHRSMIADYLAFRGVEAIHLQPKLTPHSKAIGNRLDRYHPDILKVWRKS